jgi:hypothetical protein
MELNRNKKKNPSKREKNTWLAFWERLLDLLPCPLGHAGRMIS